MGLLKAMKFGKGLPLEEGVIVVVLFMIIDCFCQRCLVRMTKTCQCLIERVTDLNNWLSDK